MWNLFYNVSHESTKPSHSSSPSGTWEPTPSASACWLSERQLRIRLGRACFYFQCVCNNFPHIMRYLVSKQIKPVLGSSSLETAIGILYSFTQKLSKNLAPSPENRHSSQTKLDKPSLQTMSGENSPEGRTHSQPELKGPPVVWKEPSRALERIGSDLKQSGGAEVRRL